MSGTFKEMFFVIIQLGASAFKLFKFGFDFTSAKLLTLVIGMVVAFIVSVFVIKVLMSYIEKHDFKVFGWRIINDLLVFSKLLVSFYLFLNSISLSNC